MSKVKKCPNCGREMKMGEIGLISGIRWYDEDSESPKRGELIFTGSFWGSAKRVEAYRCNDCRLVLFEY
jgi:hypothetical protein